MNRNYPKDLFQLQTELTDVKVDMAVNKAIDRVVEQISALRNEMHEIRHRMNEGFHQIRHDMVHGFASLDKRIVAVETRLGIVGAKRKGIYERVMDYLFKAGYGALTLAVSYLAYLAFQLHPLIK